MTTTQNIKNPNTYRIYDVGGTVVQSISMDIETNELLHQVCNSNPNIPSISAYVCGLIREDISKKNIDDLVTHPRRCKRLQSRFDVIRSTILPKLYNSTGEDAFTYAIYKRFMAQPPISVIREYTLNEYLHRMISLGYIIPCEDESSWRYRPQNKIFSLESRFMLSDDLIKSQGKLEGLQ